MSWYLTRLVDQDRVALVLTLVLIAVQIALLVRVRRLTSAPLAEGADAIRKVARQVEGEGTPLEPVPAKAPPEVRRAWRLVFGPAAGNGDGVPADEAFAPARLLPGRYEARLDAAAPGLFTAVGIAGTFVGLIVGFLPLDPANATASVGPLIGGMVVAFINSFVGVVLSIVWSYRSRRRRHAFDRACDELLEVVEPRAQKHGAGAMILDRFDRLTGATLGLHARLDQGFAEIRGGLGTLGETTAESSRELLQNLAPRIQGAFSTLVNLPFDRLDESVGRFDEIIRAAAETQGKIASDAAGSAERVVRAAAALANTLAAVRETVGSLEGAAAALREQTGAAASLLEHTREAAGGLATVAGEVRGAAGHYDDSAQALAETTAGLESVSRSLQAHTAQFRAASGSLEATVGRIGEIAAAGAQEGAAAVRGELQRTVDGMAAALREVAETTVTAYEQSSHRITSTVNARVTDLTDRLSAELTTLSARLPAEVEALNGAMMQIRASIQRATHSMDRAANDLARQTPERLRVYLNELDEAVAQAVSRFAGTLGQWDDKLGEVEQLTAELRRLSEAMERRRTIRLPQGVVPAA
jgi:ABC-type transporter Mla subunit MlaD